MSHRFAIWLALGMASCSLPVLSQDNPAKMAPPVDQHENTAESEAALIALSKAQPTNPEPFARLGLLEARRGDYPQAIIFYRKAMALNPRMPGLALNLGLALFKDGQYKQAIQIFTPMLKAQSPSSPEKQRLTILLGMSHYGLGEFQAAVPYLQQAADGDAQNLPLLLTLAHSCLLSKQYPCVLDAYHRMVAQNAESAEADMLVGEALDEKGDDAGAIEQFRNAAKAEPKEPNVHFGLGYLLWKEQHFDEAAKEFEAELGNDPADQRTRAYLGDSLVELNQYEQAQPDLEAAAGDASTTTMAMVHRDLGVVYAEGGRKEDATNELLKAIALDPKDVSPHWRLGKLYQSMGKKDDAREQFAIASAMNKENSRPLTQEMGGDHPKPQP